MASGVAVAVVVVILAAPSAFAKGPSQGVITGPGLARPLTLREPGSTTIGPDLANVVMQTGFFVGTFGGTLHLHGNLAHRPAGSLGPRYTITYTMALPDRHSSQIVQYVYPYAEPKPITYMPRNQKYWGSNKTVGAWYAAHVGFRRTLVRLGLPATPLSGAQSPAVGSDAGSPLGTVPGGSLAMPLWIAAALVVVMIAAFLTRRRRTRQSVRA